MAAETTEEYQPSYRERSVDDTLTEHDNRISKNEKRWLMVKGAAFAFAATNAGDGISYFAQLI